MKQDEIEQLLKVNTLEAQVTELTKKIDKLSQALIDHMDDENEERRATDKKLNLHTILLIAVGLGSTGSEFAGLVAKLVV